MTPPFTSPSLPINNTVECFSCPPPKQDTKNFAFVTLLTRDSYLMGVQCLYRSLQAVHSKHPLVVIYTPDTLTSEAASILQNEGLNLIMRPVNKRYFPPISAAVDHTLYKMECYADCWNKLLMWEMEEYDLLVYLDADMVCLKNIDHLFHKFPANSNCIWAVPDCAAGRETEEERDQCSLLRHNIKINGNQHATSCSFSYFNAGMFIFQPSRTQFNNFHQALSSGTCPIPMKFAEQDFLNHYFRDTWQPLPILYNLQKGIRGHHPEMWCPEEAFILHYTDCKPWHGRDHPENVEYSDIVTLWWDIYTNFQGKKAGF